jgi:hypothetical protein
MDLVLGIELVRFREFVKLLQLLSIIFFCNSLKFHLLSELKFFLFGLHVIDGLDLFHQILLRIIKNF